MAAVLHLVEAARQNHFALSETDHLRLQNLENALQAVATLTERNVDEDDPEISSDHLGGLFRVLADQVATVLASVPFARGSEALFPKC